VYHGVYALIGCLSIVSSHAIISMNRPSRPHGVLPANEAVRSESANHAASRAEGSQHMRDTL